MRLETIYCGGAEDSALPRKAHLFNVATEKPYCGQHFPRFGNVECSDIAAEAFEGAEACSKCLRLKARAIADEESRQNRETIQVEA